MLREWFGDNYLPVGHKLAGSRWAQVVLTVEADQKRMITARINLAGTISVIYRQCMPSQHPTTPRTAPGSASSSRSAMLPPSKTGSQQEDK